MSTVLAYREITKIPDTEPEAVPSLWNSTYAEIDANLQRLADENDFGVCSTAAATAAKTVTKANFALSEGAHIAVYFSANNTAENPTLNVSETGAFAIYFAGKNIPTSAIQAGKVYEFRYKDSKWIAVGDLDKSSGGSLDLTGDLSAENGNFSGWLTADKDPILDPHLANKRYVDAGDVYGKGVYAAIADFNTENGIQ